MEKDLEILEAFVSEVVKNDHGHPANVVDVLDDIARALRLLGNADAATPMGGLEAHGAAILEAADKVAGGLHDVAEAIRETKE